jgi:hypothetical protein
VEAGKQGSSSGHASRETSQAFRSSPSRYAKTQTLARVGEIARFALQQSAARHAIIEQRPSH